ncbi:MAG: TM2 domain-containing protein, partial [bacterium]
MSEESSTPLSTTPPTSGFTKEQKDKKLIAGLLGILLGGLGIHKFYLGYTKEGIIQIVVTIVTCGFGSIVGLIEGILYLTKTDDEFVATYVVG